MHETKSWHLPLHFWAPSTGFFNAAQLEIFVTAAVVSSPLQFLHRTFCKQIIGSNLVTWSWEPNLCLLRYNCLQYGLLSSAHKTWLGLSFSAHQMSFFGMCDFACHSQSMSCPLLLCQNVKLSRYLGIGKSILFFPQVCFCFTHFRSFQGVTDHAVGWREFFCKGSCLWDAVIGGTRWVLSVAPFLAIMS